ncbi:MAG TPA: isochorismate synthase [Solirubrobacteraceae bacterium]|nr:isochorismate synthase [Solirubrobacteraceae bacterium]
MSEAAPGVEAGPSAGTAASGVGAPPGVGLGNPGRADAPSRFALTGAEQERLASNLRKAVERARRSGEQTLASISLKLPSEVDPTEVACASRRADEPWLVFEQPDHGRASLAGLGEAIGLQASGPERFEQVARRWRELSAAAVGEGAIAVGGFSFAPDGGSSPHWQGYEPASLVVPEVVLTRRERRVRLTLTALASPDDLPDELLARLLGRVGGLEQRGLPLLDPAPSGRFQVASTMPPEHFESAVARASELIGLGQMEKIVLAREVQVHAPGSYEPAAILGVLREEFPSCFTFCVGRGDAAFVAASPELLVRREGHRVSTLALAGSTRRSADPAVDDHLGEQLLRDESYREEHAIVARRIERMLRAHAVWVAAAPEPELVRIANIQHLATPIRAQLASPMDALELVGMMHPTPAVGGEPLARAAPLIPALEGLDRGWYAGPVGWTDTTGDGEFCVALRCALLRGSLARCYAGNGIVRDSEPAAELAETEIKLQALLPLLTA